MTRRASPTGILVLLALAAALLLAPAASAQKRTVPRGWIGVGAPHRLMNQPSLVEPEFQRMRRAGVESARVPFFWFYAQPRSASDAEWTRFDRVVAAAARARIAILPTVLGAPRWAASSTPVSVLLPRDPNDYARFLGRAVRRYGPDGVFWKTFYGMPMPIRRWQVWNEPNHKLYFPADSWEKRYTKILIPAYRAIKRNDPGASVVLGGMTGPWWTALGSLYEAGAGPYFDAVAVHPYTREPSNVMRGLGWARDVMREHGDAHKGLMLTELSWPASKGRAAPEWCTFCVSGLEQASLVSRIYRLLAVSRQRLGITGAYWHSWLSSYKSRRDPFDYSGLRRQTGRKVRDTKSLAAFTRMATSLAGRPVAGRPTSR